MKIPYKQRYTFYNKELDKNRYCYQSTPNLSLKQARLQLHSSSVKETIKVRTSALIMDPTEMVHRTVAFFKGTVLDGEDDYKLYLNEIIEQYTGRKIESTSLLFRFDPLLPKLSIHNYIDNKPQIVLVAKLSNGFYLAGYSESPLSARTMTEGKGFIASLSNRKVFPVKEDKKALKYDNLYMIFGNSELRVSPHDRKIYSNLGINNAHFEARGESVDTILGEGTRKQTPAEAIEIHQISFK